MPYRCTKHVVGLWSSCVVAPICILAHVTILDWYPIPRVHPSQTQPFFTLRTVFTNNKQMFIEDSCAVLNVYKHLWTLNYHVIDVCFLAGVILQKTKSQKTVLSVKKEKSYILYKTDYLTVKHISQVHFVRLHTLILFKNIWNCTYM